MKKDITFFNYISLLNRRLSIVNNKIQFNTDKVYGVEYALYISHKKGTEKHAYSNNPSFLTSILPLEGNYFARLFYKQGENIVCIKTYFNINKHGEINSSEVLTIADEDKYSVEYYPNNSAITFIVFNKDGTNKGTVPFGLFFLLKLGFNVIAIKQDNDKYQSLSFLVFKNLISALVLKKKVFLYGSSLGGYCAVYYGGAVNGTVIAAVPRNSYHPILKDRVAVKGEFLHDSIISNSLTEKAVVVILDPYHDIDKLFFEEIIFPAYPDLQLIEVPYAGHEVLLHLNRKHQLKDIILNIVYGK